MSDARHFDKWSPKEDAIIIANAPYESANAISKRLHTPPRSRFAVISRARRIPVTLRKQKLSRLS